MQKHTVTAYYHYSNMVLWQSFHTIESITLFQPVMRLMDEPTPRQHLDSTLLNNPLAQLKVLHVSVWWKLSLKPTSGILIWLHAYPFLVVGCPFLKPTSMNNQYGENISLIHIRQLSNFCFNNFMSRFCYRQQRKH